MDPIMGGTIACADPSPRSTLRPVIEDRTRIDESLDLALDFLRREQRADMHWVGALSSSALATAVAIVALHVVDAARFAERIARGRRWLMATQGADGGWGDAVIDPSNINATSLAIGALIYTAADPRDQGARQPLQAASACLARFGGWEAVGDPARCTLSGPARTVAALAGLLDWRLIKRLRPEVLLLPPRLRRTISTTFPAYLSIASVHARMAPHPLNVLPTYDLARERVPRWLAQAQGPDGSFEASAFLTSVIILCMALCGRSDLPWLPAAIDFVLESQREDGSWPIDRDLETFDTAMTVLAFDEAAAAVPGADAVRSWLLARQIDEPCFPTGARPGGWAWAMPSGWPECDDTAYALLALLRLGVPATAAPIKRGARWLERMQNGDGSWSTFVRNSRMPFDHDCPYITGHVLCSLQAAGRLGPRSRILGRTLAYLGAAQRHDGSFDSIWFRKATAGTASVLEALADCGLAETPLALRARDALLRSQNDDGSWGGMRLQAGTVEETSWALLALLRCPAAAGMESQVRRGVDWLLRTQTATGDWPAAPIGLYYSAMWYSDSSFPRTLATQALARVRRRDVRP